MPEYRLPVTYPGFVLSIVGVVSKSLAYEENTKENAEQFLQFGALS